MNPNTVARWRNVHFYFVLWDWDGTSHRIMRSTSLRVSKRAATPTRVPRSSTARAARPLKNSPKAAAATARTGSWTIEIVKRPNAQADWRFVPKRWIVERTIAWITVASAVWPETSSATSEPSKRSFVSP